MSSSIEQQLTGGHPNSLGNTEAVVESVLENRQLFEELYQCYFSNDEVVRLRVSSCMKRICKAQQDWIYENLNRFLSEISKIDQASTQWTLAWLYRDLEKRMTLAEKAEAQAQMQHNIQNHKDWIVLNECMNTLTQWAKKDDELKDWLVPELQRISKDSRKAVAGRAGKMMKELRANVF